MTAKLKSFSLIGWDDIPSIDLYLDQVMIIIEESFSGITKEKDKVITSTIINNYVKQKIISPTVKKKYSRDHVTDLIMITALKRVFSTNEIILILGSLKDGRQAKSAYELFCSLLDRGISEALTGKYTENISPCPQIVSLAIRAVSNKIVFDCLAADKGTF